MKVLPQSSLAALCAGVVFPVAADVVLFTEAFNSALNLNWVGRDDRLGSITGAVVDDPLSTGRGNVLTFTGLSSGGDMFSSIVLETTGTVTFTLDYLGLRRSGSISDEFGGFAGTSKGFPSQNVWLFGTQAAYPTPVVHLIDDGAWHTYSVTFSGADRGAFRVMLEDFGDLGGVAGDAFFDNIVITSNVNPIPEPAIVSLVTLGLATLLLPLRRTARSAR